MFVITMKSTILPLPLIVMLFLTTLQTITNVHAQNITQPLLTCSESNFTTNSTYQSNLKLLLSQLISTTVDTGFTTSSQGHQQPSQQVFGAGLCRVDVSKDQCKQCLSAASELLQQNCSLSIEAQVWEDKCMLRYSNASFSFQNAANGIINLECSDNNVTELQSFEATTKTLMEKLAMNAAYNSSKQFATGEANYSGSSKVYGLMQCTRDNELTQDECSKCLSVSLDFASGYCWGRQGGAAAMLSCYMRFENYSFYNQTAMPPNTSSLAPPARRPGVENPDFGSSAAGKRRGLNISERLFLIITPTVCALVSAVAMLICLWRRRRYFISISNIDDVENKQPETRLFNLSVLRDATGNFSHENKLGEGGFGAVYKGVLADGLEIAVKRLSKSSKQGLVELRNEVLFVAKLQHKNLVRLLGFCLEEKEKLLVYEFLPNRSLDKFLFDPSKCGELDWQLRHKIIEGIAKGLLYLHEDSQVTIVHRDLKASNILLDQNMNAKISDFGLARLFDNDKSCESASQIAGTNGYIAPEYAMQGHFATRSDVYSYGVLVLEIVTGRKVTDFHGSGKAANLLSYVWNSWNNERVMDIVDPSLNALPYHEQEVLRCIHIGLLCVQEEPTKRPNMASVILMLNSYSVTLPTPATPGFFVKGSTTNDFENLDDNHNSAPISINYVSITTSEPR